MQAKLEEKLSFDSTRRSAGSTLPKSIRFYIQRSANRIKAEEADFRFCRHNQIFHLEESKFDSAALEYAGVPAEFQLHHQDLVFYLSIFCFQSDIVDLLGFIHGR